MAELGLRIWITEYDSEHADPAVRADNLETLYRIAFSKPAVEGVLIWGLWAGSHWRVANAAIVDLDWTLNEAGQRYQSLLAEWTTATNGSTDVVGAFQFRGFHGAYDLTLTPPGGQPTLRRITVHPDAGTQVVPLVAHGSGAAPLLHRPQMDSVPGSFQFLLTGDAGRSYAIQATTIPAGSGWTTLTNILNAEGTVGLTNATAAPPVQQFFRAELLP